MRFAVSALLATLVCAPAFAAQVKWVPLNQVEKGAKPAAAVPAAAPASPAVAPQPMPSAAPVQVSAGNQPLQITCFGSGTANKVTSATAWSHAQASGTTFGSWGGMSTWNGSGSGSTTVYGTRQQAFGDQVDVRLFSGDDRIRMPRTMLPPLHGGNAGWFRLKNVVADARSIRAKAAVNFMNNPNVFIDRVTGTISISGRAGDYSGQCQAVATDAPAKF